MQITSNELSIFQGMQWNMIYYMNMIHHFIDYLRTRIIENVKSPYFYSGAVDRNRSISLALPITWHALFGKRGRVRKVLSVNCKTLQSAFENKVHQSPVIKIMEYDDL